MRMFVKYGKKGEIISVSKVEVMTEGLEHPYGKVSEEEAVMEVKPTDKFDKLECHEICDQYKVDIKKKRLVKK